MTKMKGYEINYIENTITVTKKFLKDAGIIGSAAYKTGACAQRPA